MTGLTYETDLDTTTVEELEIGVEAGPPGSVEVRVCGEIDFDNAALLRDTLLTALAAQRGNLLLDLQQVGFCDCAGLNALLVARSTARRAGRSLRITAASPCVERLLELTGCRTSLT
ncbi:STAS domain-containing protein [Streptomyces sp. NPDC002812]|uniref:STAS domain-containing protein n=1 Tax=Streptomyces sp. NPDC002812 TaxID=3154434 RepID=UPI003326B2F4